MKIYIKKVLSALLNITLIFTISFIILALKFSTFVSAAQENSGNITPTFSVLEKFNDVPDNHWSFEYVHKLKELGITNGIGNNKFGLGMTITRAEFVAFLVRLMQWDLINPEVGSFKDNLDKNKWYYQYIETAVNKNVILKEENVEFFRPEDKITREEIAIMIVRALGFDSLARQVSNLENPFIDVKRNLGYITIAKDIGIIKGVVQSNREIKFLPDNNATREEAAAMMIRMYNKLNKHLNELHAFYAIRSYPQKDYIKDLSSVSFGWSRLEYDKSSGQVILNTSSKNNNEFSIPSGYNEPIGIARDNNIPAHLMVFLKNDVITVSTDNADNKEENDKDENIKEKVEGDDEDNDEDNDEGNDEGSDESSVVTTAWLILTNKDIRSNVIDMIIKAVTASNESPGSKSVNPAMASSIHSPYIGSFPAGSPPIGSSYVSSSNNNSPSISSTYIGESYRGISTIGSSTNGSSITGSSINGSSTNGSFSNGSFKNGSSINSSSTANFDDSISNNLPGIEFDGVVIDFENMSGDILRNAFNEFLYELKTELKKYNKSLWVAVHPRRAPGQGYYDAYDYKTIGEIADRIILMAHDYSAKQLTDEEKDSGYYITPLTPIKEVYFALKSITDEKDGVEDPSKVLLQISFDSAQWKLKEGKVTNSLPFRPDYEAIIQRLLKEGTEILYSKIDENPYARYIDPTDGTVNIIWYEDSRSVEWKIKLAKLFDIGGISIWRLGNIPNSEKRLYMDVWDTITTSINPALIHRASN